MGGGVNILATSPPDGNSTTNGYVSTATFNNLFVNPNHIIKLYNDYNF